MINVQWRTTQKKTFSSLKNNNEKLTRKRETKKMKTKNRKEK